MMFHKNYIVIFWFLFSVNQGHDCHKDETQLLNESKLNVMVSSNEIVNGILLPGAGSWAQEI